MNRIQEPPFAIQIELVEGCNLRCSFCGLQGIRKEGEKNYKYITCETMEVIGKQANIWGSRLEFAMHGEPTMHFDYIGMVAVLRHFAPRCQIMMTSNGGGLLPDILGNIDRLFKAGLDILALDEYDGIKIVSKIRKALAMSNFGYHVYEYPIEPQGNPHRRYKKEEIPFVSLMADPSSTKSYKTPKIINHCGAAFPLNTNGEGKRCHKPFREMSIRWNGDVAICCNDWRGTYKCGNINDIGMEAVWQSTAMDAARRRLYRGERDFGPCDGCDAVSYRVGLLPDPAGKDDMPQPTAKSNAEITKAISGKSYTEPVLRPWEKV